MKIENISVMNFENALRGARNPLESWHKIDSYFDIVKENEVYGHCLNMAEKWKEKRDNERLSLNLDELTKYFEENCVLEKSKSGDLCKIALIGPDDMSLCQKLIHAGPEHRKFMRQIFVSMDLTAPLYWWKEMDKYQIGTVTNSCSTMHKLKDTPITLDCFEIDDYNRDLIITKNEFGEHLDYGMESFSEIVIQALEKLRLKYLETKDKKYWKELIRWLPESWLQKRTMAMNYENLYSICIQREGHRLSEWKTFIKIIGEELPYSQDLLFFY
ncbi:MAG: hypothetical protein [Caudoviricetes sp.]|nr:MAG: hypothetical protein [Caudoviricetes sp.]